MKTVMIKINIDNAAFENEGAGAGVELARILRRLASECEGGVMDDMDNVAAFNIYDTNGNTVGKFFMDKS